METDNDLEEILNFIDQAPVAEPISFAKKCELVDAFAAGKFVVHTEFPYRHYLVFEDNIHFEMYMGEQPMEQRCFHEAIEAKERGIYVDIDDYETSPDNYKNVGNSLVGIFINSFNE